MIFFHDQVGDADASRHSIQVSSSGALPSCPPNTIMRNFSCCPQVWSKGSPIALWPSRAVGLPYEASAWGTIAVHCGL